MLKIYDEEITENPNPENDLYTDYQFDKGISYKIICAIWFGFGIILGGYWGYYLVLLWLHIREFCWELFMISMIYACGVWTWGYIGSSEWREKTKRNNIMKKGKKLPGIVIKNERIERKQFGNHGSTTMIVYVLTIRCSKKIFQMEDVFWNPELVLENPYCDVYVYKKKAVPTNFKVMEKYIKENGTEFDSAKAIDDTWAIEKPIVRDEWWK